MSVARRIGGFEVVRELGRGGMGVVYEVRDPALPERRLALKLIIGQTDGDALARFGREVELLARVRHRNVVPVHSLARAPEGPYVVMDVVEGESLSARAARGVSPRDAAALVRDLCDAVAALHEVGIVHRDLKPANVIVRTDGAPVLLDFGVARAVTGASLTRTGEVVGSPRYMSPEQAQGKGAAPIDARSDVYGLGAILFELLAGVAPFADVDGSPFNVLVAVMEREPTWPPGRPTPPALQAICRRAMAKSPADRFQTAAELRAALEQALVDDADGSARVGARALASAGLALALLVGVAAFALRDPRRSPPTTSPEPVTIAPPRSAAVTSEPPAVTSTAPRVLARRWTLAHSPGDARGLWLGPERVVTTGGAELRLWDLSGPTPSLLKTTPTGYAVGRAAVARDRLLVSSEGLQAFTLDDLVALPGQQHAHYDGQRRINDLALSPDGRHVAYGYESGVGVLHVGSVERLEAELLASLEVSSRIRAVAFSPRGDRLFCTSATMDPRVLCVWDLGPDGLPRSPRRDHPLMNAGVAIAVSPPDGEDVVVGTARGTIVRMRPDGSDPNVLSHDGFGGLGIPRPGSGRLDAQDVAFSTDGALLFTLVGDDDTSKLEVWARRGWTRLVTGLSIPSRARQLAPSPDGRWLLVGTVGGVEVWDVPDALRAGGAR